jgi:MFS family permease
VRPAEIGLVYTIAAVGGLTGAGVAPFLVKRVPTGLLSITAGVVVGAGLVPVAFTNNVAVIGACTAVALCCIPACSSAVGAYQMAITPDRLQARTSSAIGFAGTVLLPLAPLTGGVLLTLFGGSVAMVTLAVLTVSGALIMVSSAELRRLPVPGMWETVEANPDQPDQPDQAPPSPAPPGQAPPGHFRASKPDRTSGFATTPF